MNYILNDISKFLIKPEQVPIVKIGLGKKVQYLFILWLFTIIAALFQFIIMEILIELDLMKPLKNTVRNGIDSEYNLLFVNIIAIVLAPILEELAYRAHLKFSLNSFLISTTLLFYITFSYVTSSSFYIVNFLFILKIFVSIILFFFVLILIKKYMLFNSIERLWTKNYILIFYLTVLFFAIAHLPNYGDLTINKLFYSPLILFPVIMYGFLLGYTRIKLGLGWAITLHAMINGFPALLKLLLP